MYLRQQKIAWAFQVFQEILYVKSSQIREICDNDANNFLWMVHVLFVTLQRDSFYTYGFKKRVS